MGALHKTVFKGKVEEISSYLSSLLRTVSTSVVDNKDMIEFGRVAVSSASWLTFILFWTSWNLWIRKPHCRLRNSIYFPCCTCLRPSDQFTVIYPFSPQSVKHDQFPSWCIPLLISIRTWPLTICVMANGICLVHVEAGQNDSGVNHSNCSEFWPGVQKFDFFGKLMMVFQLLASKSFVLWNLIPSDKWHKREIAKSSEIMKCLNFLAQRH